MRLGRLPDADKELFDRNPELGRKVVGDPVWLDSSQESLFALYSDLRREAGSEQGIKLPAEMDPILLSHLRALDDEYMKERAAGLEDMKNRNQPRPAPPSQAVQRHRT